MTAVGLPASVPKYTLPSPAKSKVLPALCPIAVLLFPLIRAGNSSVPIVVFPYPCSSADTLLLPTDTLLDPESKLYKFLCPNTVLLPAPTVLSYSA